ncbi:MAG: restriction endonuclease [Gammaproteobacteria bacterium RIFCSPLOWO2_02_FULL_57_10]|nr:MAG: restriction endonuclease [Gammaproteobacteria bacterium RIFCSPLOWO2_02_FULL_57_10]
MAIPDFQSCMRPLLVAIADGEPTPTSEAFERVTVFFKLSDDERDERLPSGKQTVIRNRVAWANTYLKKALLINATDRGVIQITDRGRDALIECPKRIDVKYLKRFPEFAEFHQAKPTSSTQGATSDYSTDELAASNATPDELIEKAHSELTKALASQLLESIKRNSPWFFEQLVVDLMIAMGYGGARAESGRATKPTGDDGIDGIINEDKLGLDTIYLQAKRWENTVHRPETDKFIGSLTRQGARKGVFITTSEFSEGARTAASGLNISIVLIDGQQLARYMIEYNIGVNIKQSFHVKDIDTDYFNEE